MWYKGNLHTHTTDSDGDWAPEEVVRRYKAQVFRHVRRRLQTVPAAVVPEGAHPLAMAQRRQRRGIHQRLRAEDSAVPALIRHGGT